jgi:hypothetical protein
MLLRINNQQYTFIPLQTFRKRWQLLEDFTIDRFDPKNWAGLGSLKTSSQAMKELKQRLIEAVPPLIIPIRLIDEVDTLTDSFRHELETINPQIGLRPAEIDFAAAGFQDVLHAVGYHLLQLAHTHRHNPALIGQHFDFAGVHQIWLDESVRVSTTVHNYLSGDNQFQVQVIYYAYGRVGLEVIVPTGESFYVTDSSLACPASQFMETLEEQVAQVLVQAFLRGMGVPPPRTV